MTNISGNCNSSIDFFSFFFSVYTPRNSTGIQILFFSYNNAFRHLTIVDIVLYVNFYGTSVNKAVGSQRDCTSLELIRSVACECCSEHIQPVTAAEQHSFSNESWPSQEKQIAHSSPGDLKLLKEGAETSGCKLQMGLLLVRNRTQRDVTHDEMHTCAITIDSSLSKVVLVVISVITAIEGHFLRERSLIGMTHWLLVQPPPTTLSVVRGRPDPLCPFHAILLSIPPLTVSLNSSACPSL